MEADPATLNLTAYEDFDEKKNIFLIKCEFEKSLKSPW